MPPLPPKVLLVEDDSMLCLLLNEALVFAGLAVVSAGTAQEALEAYKKTRYDIVVLDLKLPDRSGFEVLSDIRELKQEPPPRVVVFSGVGDPMAHRRAAELGVDEYLAKPADVDYLTSRVKALAHRLEHMAGPPFKNKKG